MNERLTLLLNLSRCSQKNLIKALKFLRQFSKCDTKVFETFMLSLYAKQPCIVQNVAALAHITTAKTATTATTKTTSTAASLDEENLLAVRVTGWF